MEEFSIELGAKLKLDSLQEQINKASSNLKPLEITINTEKSEKKITALTEQISKLNNEFKIMENMGSLSSNLNVIDKSLHSIATVIDKINKADGFNNLSKGLSSFAPVAEMIKNELSAIKDAMTSFKGINFNLDIKPTIGRDALSVAKENALFELRQQLNAIESVYMQYTKAENVIDAAVKAFRGTEFGKTNNVLKSGLIAHDESLSINQQISAVQNYINMLQQGAKTLDGINLTSVTSTFTKTADEIVASSSKISSGEQVLSNETNQLKKIFGSGIDSEKLTAQLDAIKVSIDNVSTAISGIKFDNNTLNTFKETITSLNTAINQLSTSITELDNKPIISKTTTTGVTQTTQEIQKAEVETQKLKQTTEQIKPVGNNIINSQQRIKFETEIKGIISSEQLLTTKTRDYFQSFGDITTDIFRNKNSEISKFVVTIKNAIGEIESLTYKYIKEIDPSNGKTIFDGYRYTGSSGSDNYARQLESDRKQTERNTAVVTKYTSALQILQKEYLDVNASKPITNTENIEHLNSLYDEAIAKVNTLGTATKESFASSEASVKAAIAEIRSQVKIYREVESMANQLRAKPIETIKGEQIQLLREFEAKIKSSGIALEQLKSYSISDLSVKLGGVTDRQSLTEYLNMLVVAKAEFKALQAEQKNYSQMQKASADKEKAALKEVENEYQNLISLVGQIGKKRISLFGLDSESEKDIPKITRIKEELRDLYTQYAKAKMTFTTNFPTYNLDELKVKWQGILRSIELAKNETIGNIAYKSSQEEINKEATAYKELLSSFDKYKAERIALSKINPENPKYDVVREEVLRLATDYRKLRTEFTTAYPTHNIDELRDKLHSLGYELRQVQGDNVNKANQQAEKTEQEKVNSAYKETLSLIQQIKNIQTNLLNLDKEKDSNQILELEGQLKRLQESYQAIRQAFNSKFSSEQTTEINNALQTTIDKMATVQAKIDDVKASSVRSIKDNISNGTLENQIQALENDYRRLGLTEDEITQKVQTLKSLLKTMDESDDIESVTRDYTTFCQEVVKAQNNVKALRREQQKVKDEANLANNRQTLNSQIDVWLKKNSAAASQFGARLREIQQELLTADGTKLTALKREFQEIKRQAELAGKATMTLGDKLKSKLGSLATYFSATMMISYAIRGIRSMYQNVLEVDTAMTELYRVTDLTGKQYSQLYDSMVAGAKKYNAALNDVVSATAEWVRFGFDANLSEQLAELTVMYQHVTDLDHKLATENLLTAYKGFQPSLDAQFDGDAAAAVEHILDVYDKLNNELPVSAAQIAEGVNKTASVLEEAGATFEQASALIVGGGSVTQDFDAMGNSIKIATLRIHGMKGKLEELGEEVDENIQSVSKIQTQILNLTHGKVNIFKDDGEHFRNIYDVFKDIASVWDSLSDTESAELLELIAGIFYQNVQRCA